MSFPIARRFLPKQLALGGDTPRLERADTPYGYAYSQVLSTRNVGLVAAATAAEIGADPRAAVHVEPLLRWRMSERTRTAREPVVLSCAAVDQIGGVSADVGVLLLVACQLVLPTEAWRTYRDVFTEQPIGAALSPLVGVASVRTPPPPPAVASAAERARRDAVVERLGAAGEALFAACGTSCPTTLDTLVALGARGAPLVPPPAPTAGATLRDDAEDSDDMTIDALARRATTAGADVASMPIDEQPPAPPPDAEVAWRRSCLAGGKYRIDLIVRGYVARRRVVAARRVAACTGELFYVLPATDVCASADAALAAPVPAPAPAPLPSTPAAPMADAPPIAVPPTLPRHPLDRLARLELTRLTRYEIDRATRDRFSVLAHLDAYFRSGTPLAARATVGLYPRGYGAPVLQPYASAPGLLGRRTTTPHDYAAIGLAGLCLVAAGEPRLRQWLLDAEACFFRLRRQRVDDDTLAAYLARIDEQIAAARPPPADSELGDLLRDIADAASAVVASVDALAASDEASDDGKLSDIDESSDTEAPNDE